MAQQPFTPEQLAQLIAALQQVLPAVQVQAQPQAIVQVDPTEALNEALRKIRIEGVTPLDVTDKGSTYRAWVLGVERNLYHKHRLLDIITGVFPCPPGPADDAAVTDWQIRNNAAVSILLSVMTPALRERIPPTNTAAEIWQLLRASGTSFTAESLHALLNSWVDMRYHEDEEDIGGFWAKYTGAYDELREPTDAQGRPLYALTPFMLLGHLLHALPPTWDEVARDLRALQPQDVNLDDIYRRLRAFELNNKARQEVGSASKVGGVHPGGNKPEGQNPAATGGGANKAAGQYCSYCSKGPHPAAKCYTRLRDEYVAQHPGAPVPSSSWIRSVVGAGFKSPVNWAVAIQKLGAPTPAAHQPGQPLDSLGPDYRAYLSQIGPTPASPSQD